MERLPVAKEIERPRERIFKVSEADEDIIREFPSTLENCA